MDIRFRSDSTIAIRFQMNREQFRLYLEKRRNYTPHKKEQEFLDYLFERFFDPDHEDGQIKVSRNYMPYFIWVEIRLDGFDPNNLRHPYTKTLIPAKYVYEIG